MPHPPSTEPTTKVSVLTLGRGRDAHLRNVITGLKAQKMAPSELIIGAMQPAPYTDLPQAGFPIRQVMIGGDALPLARARNAVAAAATGDLLVFLDIDCIPGPDLIADYAAHTHPGAGLIMGEVMYLPKGAATPGWSFDAFDQVAQRHSDRQGPPDQGTRDCNDYRCFWSLNFAMHRADWDRTDGFDEDFVGYGGEDTDFGRQLAEQGMPIKWMRGGKVYHQYHPHCMPPIHHIPAILTNTQVFARKWGHRTMEHWLSGFRMLGLIDEVDGELRQIREPGPQDFALCEQQAHMPYANTARVLRLLRAQSDMAAE